MSEIRPFKKNYSSPKELVELLRSRGLEISNSDSAERYLSTIGYYRLSAYMFPFLAFPKVEHRYKPASTFEKILMLYRFDKKLRLFIFNELEKIEVAVRSIIVNVGCEMTDDPFWMTKECYFISSSRFARTKGLIDTEIRHSREDFIKHFYKTYSDTYPPAWALAEILPFGVLTNIYSNIKDKRIKKRISQKFGLQIAPFESWLTIMSLTRNICCHHSRAWNKRFSLLPMEPNSINRPWIKLPTDRLKIYFNICIIKYFIDVISPNNAVAEKLKQLLASFPEVDSAAMGFPAEWESEPLWKV